MKKWILDQAYYNAVNLFRSAARGLSPDDNLLNADESS
jgi:hypothetical protein